MDLYTHNASYHVYYIRSSIVEELLMMAIPTIIQQLLLYMSIAEVIIYAKDYYIPNISIWIIIITISVVLVPSAHNVMMWGT